MGKLRVEPKVKPPVSQEQYDYYRKVLQEAMSASTGNNVYYDLDPGESSRKVRKALTYVAAKEGVDVKIRSGRGSNSLGLRFGQSSRVAAPGGRMSAGDAKKRIIATLTAAHGPMQKADILERTGISAATWNLRINELLSEGSVKREGVGRQTSYSLG